MRVKHKKWAEPLIEAHPEKITTDPAQFKGKWQSRFAKEQPIWLEVGMGKGQFAIGMAKAHPEVNFIGLDVVSTVAGIALKKSLEDEELPNLQFICANMMVSGWICIIVMKMKITLKRNMNKNLRQKGSQSTN